MKDKYINFPGRIVTFDPETQTAEVKICVEREDKSVDRNSILVERKPLMDVPVHVISGGGWHLTTPIKEGDPCVIFFSQVGYDYWLYEDKDEVGLVNGVANPILRRSFDANDGYAVVGFNTIPRAIKEYDMMGAEFRGVDRNTQRITLGEDLTITVVSSEAVTVEAPAITMKGNVEIQGDLTVTGATSLQDTLNVAGATTLEDVLDVSGATTLGDVLDVSGATSLGDNLDVSGTTSLGDNLDVSGDTSISGNLSVSGRTNVKDINAAGDLTASGSGTVGGISIASHTHQYTRPVHAAGLASTSGAH